MEFMMYGKYIVDLTEDEREISLLFIDTDERANTVGVY
jgi:hypothetical protein